MLRANQICRKRYLFEKKKDKTIQKLEYKLKLDIHKQIAYCELMINNRYNLFKVIQELK